MRYFFIYMELLTEMTHTTFFLLFPIVENQEISTYGTYQSRELCLAYMNALESGDPDVKISL